MKIGVFGMLNNPEYRQEPWRESFKQRLEQFDSVCVVCAHEPDLLMLKDMFPEAWKNGKLKAVYKYWPFPEWSYEELPKHLNAALTLAREQNCDWLVKLDIDTVIHEKDMKYLRKAIEKAEKKGKWAVSLRKLQFYMPTRFFQKAFVPFAIKSSVPIAYGHDPHVRNDLCQPIVWDGTTKATINNKKYDIPSGTVISDKKILKSRKTKAYNYDYTFRTEDRSLELLYQIEMAHARFWGYGYSGLPIEKITKQTAMEDFLKVFKERFSKMKKMMDIVEHPKHFQESLSKLQPGQWGYDLWGKAL